MRTDCATSASAAEKAASAAEHAAFISDESRCSFDRSGCDSTNSVQKFKLLAEATCT